MNTPTPLVSVCCVTYNHENYIKKCIDSILCQETDFPYEIVVYDDASSDRTAKILNYYKENNPQIFNIHISNENYYSHGPTVWLKHASIDHLKRAKGKYIALIDGDDFWTNKNKLAIQVQSMSLNNSYDICFHSATNVDKENREISINAYYGNDIKLFTPKEVILGGGGFMPTSSIFFRREILQTDLFACIENAIAGDSPVQIYGSARGGALYLPWAMSAYRVGDDSSWSKRVANNPSTYIDVQIGENKYYNFLIKSLPQYKDYFIKKIILNNISTITNLNSMLTNYKDM